MCVDELAKPICQIERYGTTPRVLDPSTRGLLPICLLFPGVARVPPCQRAETGQRAVAAAAGDRSIRRVDCMNGLRMEKI